MEALTSIEVPESGHRYQEVLNAELLGITEALEVTLRRGQTTRRGVFQAQRYKSRRTPKHRFHVNSTWRQYQGSG